MYISWFSFYLCPTLSTFAVTLYITIPSLWLYSFVYLVATPS